MLHADVANVNFMLRRVVHLRGETCPRTRIHRVLIFARIASSRAANSGDAIDATCGVSSVVSAAACRSMSDAPLAAGCPRDAVLRMLAFVARTSSRGAADRKS